MCQKALPKHRIPIPGQRIVRSVLAVWLCFAIYLLRGSQGIPFYSVIAVLQCMQPDTRQMRTVAQKRVIGTVVGAGWGLIVLLLELAVIFQGVPEEIWHFMLIGLFTGIVIYSTVLLKISETAYFTAVVFLSITINHIGDANPWLFVLNRVLDTFIGVAVAAVINRLHLPRVRHPEILFVSGLNDTIVDGSGYLSPYAKVELNRLIEDGAAFTVSTIQTPATVRELLPGVTLRLPIIVMDGAAMYDLEERTYLDTIPLSEAAADRMMQMLNERQLAFFTNTLEDDLLVVHSGLLQNEAIRRLYEEKRRSPDRHFVTRQDEQIGKILYFMVLDRAEAVEDLYALLQQEPWNQEFRAYYDRTKHYEGCKCLKIYAKNATREAMLEKLMERTHLTKTVTFRSHPGQCDVVVSEADRDVVVKEVKRRFSPVSLRGWRNIFRL